MLLFKIWNVEGASNNEIIKIIRPQLQLSAL